MSPHPDLRELTLSAIEATPSGRGSRSEQYAEVFAKVGLDADEVSRLRRDATDPDHVEKIATEFTTLYGDFRPPDPWAWLEMSVAG